MVVDVVVVVEVVVVVDVVVLVLVDVVLAGSLVLVEGSLASGAAMEAIATSAVGESDPQAAATGASASATASNLVRFTETTVLDRRGATLAP